MSALPPPQCISHLHSMSHLGDVVLCTDSEALSSWNCTSCTMCSRAFSSALCSCTHVTSAPSSLVAASYTAPLNGKGVGRYWVIGQTTVSTMSHFELCSLGFCWGCHLIYILILSTVYTKCMLMPQKLN